MINELLTFDDVLIAPNFSFIESRKDVSLATSIRSLEFHLPVIAANMDTITDQVMARAMLSSGAQACLHRFSSVEDNVNTFRLSFGNPTNEERPMVSIGLGTLELDRAKALFDAGAHTFVIDVAHGAQISVVNQTKALRELLGPYANIIVGNFATANSVKDFLLLSGSIVDAFKVGIGPGSACTTRVKTGVGYPQLSAVMEISKFLSPWGVATIADGGMKTPGDIAKALAAGARAVMVGGMLAGTDETPGEIVGRNGGGSVSQELAKRGAFARSEYAKKYRGSASKESYQLQGKNDTHRTSEGESFLVPYRGPVKDILQDIEGGLRSAFSYVGASNLDEFRNKVEFVKISNNTLKENGAHGKK